MIRKGFRRLSEVLSPVPHLAERETWLTLLDKGAQFSPHSWMFHLQDRRLCCGVLLVFNWEHIGVLTQRTIFSSGGILLGIQAENLWSETWWTSKREMKLQQNGKRGAGVFLVVDQWGVTTFSTSQTPLRHQGLQQLRKTDLCIFSDAPFSQPPLKLKQIIFCQLLHRWPPAQHRLPHSDSVHLPLARRAGSSAWQTRRARAELERLCSLLTLTRSPLRTKSANLMCISSTDSHAYILCVQRVR